MRLQTLLLHKPFRSVGQRIFVFGCQFVPLVTRQYAIRRCFSSSSEGASNSFSPSPSHLDENFHVPIRSNGFVSLTVTRPSTPPLGPTRPNVILYLPPGPVFDRLESSAIEVESIVAPSHDDKENRIQRDLADRTASTVVTVNYRLGAIEEIASQANSEETAASSEQAATGPSGQEKTTNRFYTYPTPVHDTLAGFDWIVETINPAQLCVLGSHVGGSLALMLALTEAKSLTAVAAIEPICDWPGLDDFCLVAPAESNQGPDAESTSKEDAVGKKKRKVSSRHKHGHGSRASITAPSDLVTLLELREKFFLTPERYFDAFASPMLFLRSPGKDVPRTFPKYLTGPEYPVPVLVQDPLQDEVSNYWGIPMPTQAARSVSGASSASSTGLSDETSEDQLSDVDLTPAAAEIQEKLVRRRKSLSRWPPYGLDYGLDAAAGSARPGIGRLQMTLPWTNIFVQGNTGSSNLPDNLEDGEETSEDAEAVRRATRRSNPAPASDETILSHQAEEMVRVMRRACFFGRESGFAEERVQLTRMPISREGDHVPSTARLCQVTHVT